jgi:hypothetical protein
MHNTKRLVLASTSMLLLAVVVGLAARRGQAVTYLPQPNHWVPFSADMTVTHSGTSDKIVYGRFYRSSDGSTRLETGPQPLEPLVIHIKNAKQHLMWVFRGGRWYMSPFSMGPLPPQMSTRTGLQPYPNKLALRPGQNNSVTSNSGFEAYRSVTRNGTLALMVPELNFFPVLRQRLDGRRELYASILLQEPDPALFLPPPGPTIVDVSGGHQ